MATHTPTSITPLFASQLEVVKRKALDLDNWEIMFSAIEEDVNIFCKEVDSLFGD